jgi:acyl-CoA reductase-like NAD-dependent aldehyde dehydrogenase
VELLGVARRVARADIALTQHRLAAFPQLRPLIEDRVAVGSVALALPGNAILSNPVATVLCAAVAGNEVTARLPRRRRPWTELLRELLRDAELPATQLVEGDGASFLAESLADPDVAVAFLTAPGRGASCARGTSCSSSSPGA